MTALIVVETAVLVLLSILVVGLLRSYATVLERLHRLDGGDQAVSSPAFRTAQGVVQPADRGQVGLSPNGRREEWSAAHDIDGVGLSGEIISVRTVAVLHDTIIAFLSSGCTGCAGFWEQLTERHTLASFGNGRLLVVTKGPADESVTALREVCPPGIDLVMSGTAWTDYSVPGSPYVVVVDGQTGRVKGEGSGTSFTQLSGLIHQAIGDIADEAHRMPVNKPRSDADREVDIDRVLLAAGIGPGHPSLYGDQTDTTTPIQAGSAMSDQHPPTPKHPEPGALR